MYNHSTQPFAEHIGPWKLLIITVVSSFLGFQLLGILIGVLVALPFYDGGAMGLLNAMADPVGNPDVRMPILIIQGVGSAFGLIFIPWFIYTKIFSLQLNFGQTRASLQPVIYTVLIVIFFMAVNSPVVEWNQNIQLPQAFSGFEQVLKSMEKDLEVLTKYMTSFETTSQFLFGVLIIAVIPAIGEELVFRGLVQNHFFRITKNIHVAIWLAALLFGAIHMQFYGMFARMLLGVVFGYLYYYSGNLFYSMLAHFINNGVAVLAVYMYNKGQLEYDMESAEALPWYQVLLSTVVFVLLFLTFIRNFKPKKSGA
ncbi:MAG: CPBP family intramembrane metalloprotease [Cyclobacteriaceae bacterium]|nr:CPBP family intramembrane metalloprotease [Cyclobacteriaceae bacterium]